MIRLLKLVFLLLMVAALNTVAFAAVSVSVSPQFPQVKPGGQVQFSAVVSGTTNNVVIWSVTGAGCAGNACGQIKSNGLYTAPASTPNPPIVTVTATSLADLSASGSAKAIIETSFIIGVSVSPTSASVVVGNTQRFTATVTGSANTSVTWAVSGAGCSGNACGTITPDGLYAAPASVPSPSQVTVRATSNADNTKSASAVVTVAPPVAVTVSPANARVAVGHQQQFTATVTGTTNTAVTWRLNGAGCSGSTCGAISAGGLYTAPNAIPNPAQVSVTATSVADVTKSSTVTLTVIPPVVVTVSPTTAQVVAGHHQQFSATVTGTSDTSVTWRVSGVGCSGSACGTITSTGFYTAPNAVPSPAQVTVTATSNADNTKSDSSTVTILPPVAVRVSPNTAQVVTGHTQQFSAIVTGTNNTSVTWSLNGAGCSGTACGTLTQGGLYTAPNSVPNPGQVTVTATSNADNTKSGSAVVTVLPPVGVTVLPPTAQVVTGQKQQFTATVTGNSNTSVTWSLSGAGCSGSACGTITQGGLYTAPNAVPNPPQVSVTATSNADNTKFDSATVTIIPPVVVSIAPKTAQLLIGHTQQFTATVTGTNNTGVTWSLSGTGCSGSACGTLTQTGLYTAPNAAPNPAQVTVTATSKADNTKSDTASVTILLPLGVSVSPSVALVVAGGQQQFTATVTGTSNTSVTWTVTGTGCSGGSCGSITSGGLYTAPNALPNPPQVTVTATLNADHTKSGSASVTISPSIVVTVSPKTAQVVTGQQQQFTATVNGASDTSVTWRLIGAGCSGTNCGTITPGGLYTAPSNVPRPPQVVLTAISNADDTKSASATVTIVRPTTVSISPLNAQVAVGHQQQFTARINGVVTTNINWTITGSGCSGTACGTITTTGLYTAPNALPNPALVTVTATSKSDSTKSASATVTIVPPVLVNVSPATARVAAGRQQQFSATVTGTNISSVTWTVSGAGCFGSGCGTITSGGLYTAPSAIPNPADVTVRATSNADNTKSDTAVVTIVAATVVTVLPKAAIVAVDAQQQFRATITGNTNNAVTWSVSGAGCSGTACGTITADGLYTAPAGVPAPATVTVKATSLIDPSQSDSAIVTIVAHNNEKLRGQYAFLFTGFDSGGVYQTAGTFHADGAGNLTSGLEDVNSSAGPAKKVAFTGTYRVGNDNRGAFTINDTFGSRTFRFALDLLGTKGRLIQFDGSGIRGSGIIQRQDPSAFKTSALAGGYVLSLTGRDVAGSRIGALGVIYPSGAGFITGGSLDVNDGGVLSPTFGSFGGTLNVDSTSRGMTTLSIPGFDGGTFNFAIYVISVNKFLMVSVDPLSANNPIFSGLAELQSGTPFLGSAFTGPSVFSISGIHGSSPDDAVGQILFSGSGQLAVDFDENDAGKITTDGEMTGAYDIQLNGRGTLNLDGTGQNKTWFLYAVSPNRAFLMDATSTAVSVGELTPQIAAQPFSNRDFIGSYLLGSGEPVVSTTSLYSGVVDFNGAANSHGFGLVSGVEDISLSSSLQPDQTLSGTYIINAEQNGRADLLLTAPGKSTIALWVSSPIEIVGLSVDPSTTQPVILHFEQ